MQTWQCFGQYQQRTVTCMTAYHYNKFRPCVAEALGTFPLSQSSWVMDNVMLSCWYDDDMCNWTINQATRKLANWWIVWCACPCGHLEMKGIFPKTPSVWLVNSLFPGEMFLNAILGGMGLLWDLNYTLFRFLLALPKFQILVHRQVFVYIDSVMSWFYRCVQTPVCPCHWYTWMLFSMWFRTSKPPPLPSWNGRKTIET